MPGRLERRPLATTLALVLAALLLGALLVLPRLDAVEIASAERAAPHAALVHVRVRFRLASAPAGALRVRLPAPRGGRAAEARIELVRGSGEHRLELALPPGVDVPVATAELLPAGGGEGLLGRLLAGRRRDARRVRP